MLLPDNNAAARYKGAKGQSLQAIHPVYTRVSRGAGKRIAIFFFLHRELQGRTRILAARKEEGFRHTAITLLCFTIARTLYSQQDGI